MLTTIGFIHLMFATSFMVVNRARGACDWAAVVTTGTVLHGGTNDEIRIQIIFENDISTEYYRLNSKNDDFEKGKSDVYSIKSRCLKPTKIKMKIGGSDGWYLEKVELLRKDIGNKYLFVCHCWLDNAGTKYIHLHSQGIRATCDWTAVVWTGTELHGGTDDEIRIQMFDSKKSTEYHRLTNKYNDFEKGNVDVYSFKSKCLIPTKIRMKIGGRDAWYLYKVELQRSDVNTKYVFVCQCWLDNAGTVFVNLKAPGSPDHCDWLAIVFTSYTSRADTDDSVKIKIFSSTESTANHRLTSKKNDFENGATDYFWFQSKCIEAEKVLMTISGNDGWNLAKVELYRTGPKGTYKYAFDCQCWIDDGGSKFMDVKKSIFTNKLRGP